LWCGGWSWFRLGRFLFIQRKKDEKKKMENKEKEEKDKERMKNNNNPNPKKSSRFSSSFLSVPFFSLLSSIS